MRRFQTTFSRRFASSWTRFIVWRWTHAISSGRNYFSPTGDRDLSELWCLEKTSPPLHFPVTCKPSGLKWVWGWWTSKCIGYCETIVRNEWAKRVEVINRFSIYFTFTTHLQLHNPGCCVLFSPASTLPYPTLPPTRHPTLPPIVCTWVVHSYINYYNVKWRLFISTFVYTFEKQEVMFTGHSHTLTHSIVQGHTHTAVHTYVMCAFLCTSVNTFSFKSASTLFF